MWIKKLYERVIAQHEDAVSFIILVFFLGTFVISRVLIHLFDAGVMPDFYLMLGQTHVHHLNYGIFLISIAGYLAIARKASDRYLNYLAAVFGIGLGLTFDEFSLWFHLTDSYYSTLSYEAVVVIAVLLINIIYFPDLWKKIFSFVSRWNKVSDQS